MSLSVARRAHAGLIDGGRGDQSAAGLRRANRSAADAVPGHEVVRSAFAAGVPRIGLVFPGRLPFEAWLGVGAQLAAVVASSAWCLGDWLVYGQAAYGSRYRKAAERTGLDYQTLRNYAWVAGRFELSRRRDTLSFGHHAEVAALPAPEQDCWLRKAEEFGWSTRRLRHEVRPSLAERRQEPVAPEPAGPARPPRGQATQQHTPAGPPPQPRTATRHAGSSPAAHTTHPAAACQPGTNPARSHEQHTRGPPPLIFSWEL